MVSFFQASSKNIIAVFSPGIFSDQDISKLCWLFGDAQHLSQKEISGNFVGPRKEMITPWSTNAVEITQNMGIEGVVRIEEYFPVDSDHPEYDPMLQAVYNNLDQDIFTIHHQPDPIEPIDDITAYNEQEGLALSPDEVKYLEDLSAKLNRKLTDSEIFGFSQVNSEHCRHKIFNGIFIIDGEQKESSLFQLIKKTTSTNRNRVVSAYKDNCAFIQGPVVEQFAPVTQDKPDYFKVTDFESVISIKAETHNFPTTVEPFNGAATGSGGEIRDRVGGGKGAIPLAGTAVYMTAYPRLNGGRSWEKNTKARPWLYQTPDDILIKASNGASDFGNKFGQPLITGSVLTFEHLEAARSLGYDKVIMLAGGIGYGKKKDSLKDVPGTGDKVVLMGGDNYRIGMGGGAVSSVDTGEFDNAIELNAVQRSNPEMQKRVTNAIRAMAEADENPIISIHDHGAGGHLNCLSELVEETGGKIEIGELPVGDPTLSAKEIIGNESQERMGMVMKEKDIDLLKRVADRERAPLYVIGETTGDHQFTFEQNDGGKPLDLRLEDMFGNPPATVMNDKAVPSDASSIQYDPEKVEGYIKNVLQLEAVACKDWLTNKVDRSVTGKVAKQQTTGQVQLPLNNVGVTAIDYQGEKGIAASVGHAPIPAIVDAAAGSRLAIAESLTNIIWAPIEGGIKGISLSANWMWPCKNEGEDARLYEAVSAASEFALGLEINIPTGKDSLSMAQKYPDGTKVLAPGTVIISASGEVIDIKKVVEPALINTESEILYVDLSKSEFELGGSSFAQSVNQIGSKVPDIEDANYFASAFETIQQLILDGSILAGHDVSAGGLITTLLEMAFPTPNVGLDINLDVLEESDLIKILFSEKPAVVLQVNDSKVKAALQLAGIVFHSIGRVSKGRNLNVKKAEKNLNLAIDDLRDTWFSTSAALDTKQVTGNLAQERFSNYKKQELDYNFPEGFEGTFKSLGIDNKRRRASGVKAAIIREKGVNGDREMAWAMYLAGMDVKDVHMTDLISGRETLEDVNMIVFVGGFSNSDVLGSAKGWAGAFLYNPKAKEALDKFYARKDTLSLGVCNGCQLMVELGVVTPEHKEKPKMLHNDSYKFESIFLTVDVEENNAVMLKDLAGSKLGIWVAHGEGKFSLPQSEDNYQIPLKFSFDQYPGNPNGSDYQAAGLCSADGRHLVMMPHLERSIHPWNWAWYLQDRKDDEVSPWIKAFISARKWIQSHN